MTALKTVSMYLRAAKTETEEAGESTDGMANSVSELRAELLRLTKNKVDIMIDDTTFKSTYEIFKELSEVWSSLSDIDTANILELIGGKRNATAVTSLITNFQDAEAALRAASTASGSALAENEKYLDSINGKLAILQSKFESISSNVVDSNLAGLLLNLASGAMSLLDIISRFPLILTTITAAVVLLNKQKEKGYAKELASQAIAKKDIITEKEKTEELTVAVSALNERKKDLLVTELKHKVAAGDISKQEYKNIISALGLATANKALEGSNKTLATSFKSLMASIPVWGWISLIATAVIEIGMAIYDWVSNMETATEKLARLKDELKQTTDEINGIANEYKNLKESADDIIPRFAELSHGVNEFGDNVSLTDEEYSEFLSLNNQLAELFPELNMGMDSNGNAILALSGDADTLTESLRALVEAERAAANEATAAKMPEIITNIDNQQEAIQKQIEEAEKDLKSAPDRYVKLIEDIQNKNLGWALTKGSDAGVFAGTMEDAIAHRDKRESYYKERFFGLSPETQMWDEDLNQYMLYWDYDDINLDELEQNYKNYLAGLDKKIEDLKRQEEAVWKNLNRPVNAWLQTDWLYADLNDEMQNIVNTIVGGLDFSEIVKDPKTGQEDIQNYITENIINPLFNAGDDIKKAFDKISELRNSVKLGEMTEEEFSDHVINTFDTLIESMDPEAAELFKTLLISAFSEVGEEALTFEDAVLRMADAWGGFTDEVTGSSGAKIAKTMIDTVNGLNEAYKLLATAKAEMESGGLSVDTVKSIAEAMGDDENYLDYLYEENGLIKLNIEAWKERANATALSDISTLKSENEALKNENKTIAQQITQLRGRIQLLNIKGDAEGAADLTKELDALSATLEYNTEQIEQNQELLGLYEPMFEAVTESIVDVLDFSEMTSGLDSVGSAVNSIVSAMESLANGTALTTQGLAKLALEYPKLLEASDLFTDGSISGQQSMLENILKVYEAEYDATIDTKIAELEAMNTLLQDRVKAEQDKTDVLSQIKAEEVNNNVEYQEWLTEQLSKYNDLEGQNYVVYQNGILKVTEDSLNEILRQESDMVATSAENIWQPQSVIIASSFANGVANGVSGGLQALNEFADRTDQWINNTKERINNALNDPIQAINEGGVAIDTSRPWKKIDTNIDIDEQTLNKGLEGLNFNSDGVTINNKPIDDWISEQEDISRQRIDALKSQINTNLTAINNLKDLKGLDLSDIYKTASSKNGKDVEEYIAEIEAYREALKQLESAQEFRADIERSISETDDPTQRIGLSRDLITAYLDESEAERNLMEIKRDTIEDNVKALRELGFEVEYNRKTNNLYIENLEHLNEIQADTKGSYETEEEATNAARKAAEDLIDVTEELNDDNKEATENVKDIAQAITEAKQSILDDIEQIAENAKDALSEVVGVYDTLHSAVESYNKNGYLTVDMFQSIMDLGTEYLNFLYDEHGAISFNEEAIRNLMYAKIDDMAVTKAMSLVDTIKEYRNNAEALREMADATYDATNATWGLVYAELASLGLDSDLYDAFYQQINKLRQLSEATRLGMASAYEAFGSEPSSGSGSLADYYNEAADALDYVLDKTQELIKYEVEQQVDAIKKQSDAYQELIDLRKEAIEKAKEEDDYEESIAEKVKDIAELQTKIDQLSLDDSRQAQAERNTLLAELAEKQKDLADTQKDHIYDNQVDALDKLSKDYEDNRQDEIDALEGSIDSAEKLYQAAIQRLQFNWDGLFYSLINWNTVAGNDINANITENWNKATEAVINYGSYLQAVSAIKAGAEQASSSSGNTIGFIGNALPIYHDGGVVGGKHDKEEVVALLEAGEIVLDDEKQAALYEVIDFQEELSKRLGTAINSIDLSSAPLRVSSVFGDMPFKSVDNSTKLNFEPHIEVNITTDGGVTDDEAEDFGQRIADVAMDKLYGAFERKGLTGFKSGVLKPQ